MAFLYDCQLWGMCLWWVLFNKHRRIRVSEGGSRFSFFQIQMKFEISFDRVWKRSLDLGWAAGVPTCVAVVQMYRKMDQLPRFKWLVCKLCIVWLIDLIFFGRFKYLNFLIACRKWREGWTWFASISWIHDWAT